MTELSSWFRNFQRSRTSTPSSFLEQLNVSEVGDTFQDGLHQSRRDVSPYSAFHRSSQYGQTTSDSVTRIRDANEVWHSPGVEQLADTLMVVMMNTGLYDSIPPEHNSSILRILESLGTQGKCSAALRDELKMLKETHDRSIAEFAELASQWQIKERDYKAEIKRLEVALASDGRGLHLVTNARSNSVIRDSSAPDIKFNERIAELLAQTQSPVNGKLLISKIFDSGSSNLEIVPMTAQGMNDKDTAVSERWRLKKKLENGQVKASSDAIEPVCAEEDVREHRVKGIRRFAQRGVLGRSLPIFKGATGLKLIAPDIKIKSSSLETEKNLGKDFCANVSPKSPYQDKDQVGINKHSTTAVTLKSSRPLFSRTRHEDSIKAREKKEEGRNNSSVSSSDKADLAFTTRLKRFSFVPGDDICHLSPQPSEAYNLVEQLPHGTVDAASNTEEAPAINALTARFGKSSKTCEVSAARTSHKGQEKAPGLNPLQGLERNTPPREKQARDDQAHVAANTNRRVLVSGIVPLKTRKVNENASKGRENEYSSEARIAAARAVGHQH